MSRPEIIGYVEEWEGHPGMTLGFGPGFGDGATRFIRTRPIYKPREFHARVRPGGGYLMRHAKCGYGWETLGLPHDSARLHLARFCRPQAVRNCDDVHPEYGCYHPGGHPGE